MRPVINCKRHEIINIPSVIAAEYDHELDYQADLKQRLRRNIEQENAVQKEKFKRLKAKYDREGIEFIEDENQMEGSNLQVSKRGVIKPGGGGLMNRQDRQDMNMG